MFFGRIYLLEARTQHASLPEIPARRYIGLRHAISHGPYLRSIVARPESDDHQLEKWLVGRKIKFVMQARRKRRQLFKKRDPHLFQVGFRFATIAALIARIRRSV